MNYEITGTVHHIGDEQSFASGFTKREFVINDGADKYPQMVKLEAVKDACNHLNAYEVGDPITVSFNLRGNEHNGRYFTNLQAWKFCRAKVDRPAQGARSPEFGQRATSQGGAAPPSQTATADGLDEFDSDDSIPF